MMGSPGRPSRRLTPRQLDRLVALKRQGLPNATIARRLAVSASAVGRALRRADAAQASSAAQSIGITAEHYERRRRDGLRWCSAARHWCAASAMVAGASRCEACERARNAERARRRREKNKP